MDLGNINRHSLVAGSFVTLSVVAATLNILVVTSVATPAIVTAAACTSLAFCGVVALGILYVASDLTKAQNGKLATIVGAIIALAIVALFIYGTVEAGLPSGSAYGGTWTSAMSGFNLIPQGSVIIGAAGMVLLHQCYACPCDDH